MPSRLRVNVRPDGLSIEDVYASRPPPRGGSRGEDRIALTPRSAEACLMEGIDPHDLYERGLELFAEAGLEPAIVRMVSAAPGKGEGVATPRVGVAQRVPPAAPAARLARAPPPAAAARHSAGVFTCARLRRR